MKSRKNKKMLVAVAMVLMIALVAGMGAMTYSKYITSGKTGEQTATAAKWGFVVTVNAENLFASDYKKDGANAVAKVDGSGNVVVNGTGTAKVVAPGTKGSMTINISGSAEVNAQLTIALAKDTTIKEIKYDDYYPIKWTLDDGSTTKEYDTLTEAIGALTTTTQVLAAGSTYNKDYTLSWEWPLVTATAGLNTTNRDVEDSLIGYKAAGIPWNDIVDPAQKGINGTYVGDYQLGTDASVATNYNSDTAIVTTMSFSLVVSVEQTQAS